MSAQVRDKQGAVTAFGKLLRDDSFREKLDVALQDINGKEAKEILDKILPILNFTGPRSMSSPLGQSMTINKIMQMSQRFHGGTSTFLTISLDDLNNPNAYRMTHRSMDNISFPAIVNDNAAFLHAIEEGTVLGSGNIAVDCSKSARAKAAMENPVAYVSEFKATVSDILTILLGLPPKGMAQVDRKTKHYSRRSKGIFGHTLGYYGVIEDHSKGTLHCHFILFGGLDPKLLQKYANHQQICDKISAALDSMYQVELPQEKHVPFVIKKVLKEKHFWSVGTACRTRHCSLLRNIASFKKNVFACDESWRDEFLQGNFQEQQQQLQWHAHCFTCTKGLQGCTGCRLCKPSNFSTQTKPIELVIDDARTAASQSID